MTCRKQVTHAASSIESPATTLIFMPRSLSASINAKVAQLIYEARMEAGLTQEELALLVGTKQPNIARLEDADYEGHNNS